LSDLRAFEELRVNTLADQAKRTAKKRREERDQRTCGHTYGYVQDHELELAREKPEVGHKTTRITVGDDSVRRGLLVAKMLGKREARAAETVTERALATGWRNRSVSAGY